MNQLDAELIAIREFADWLRETYPTLLGDVIKPCWPLHADMRFSLAAFRVAWREAMARGDRGDMGISVLHWEDELERARARWAQSTQGCEDGECARERFDGPMANRRARRAALEAAEKVDGAAMRRGLPPLSTLPKARRPTSADGQNHPQLDLRAHTGELPTGQPSGRESSGQDT
jgi:hypothetical protein